MVHAAKRHDVDDIAGLVDAVDAKLGAIGAPAPSLTAAAPSPAARRQTTNSVTVITRRQLPADTPSLRWGYRL